MVVTMVMVISYCYGRRTRICHRQHGSFLAKNQYGGRERSIALPSDQKTRFAGFAVRTRLPTRTRANPRQRPHTRGCHRAGANLCADAVRIRGRNLPRQRLVTGNPGR